MEFNTILTLVGRSVIDCKLVGKYRNLNRTNGIHCRMAELTANEIGSDN